MGVPKFFRWISERYPCLGEIIKDYQVPDFDNLYLDMNGIFHVCSHPDDDNAHFRITEEDIFKNICHYIEVLFRKIKPKKVFFMAVDGVAPRAKLNQQRGRRFRTAKLAEDAVRKAERTGEQLPSQEPFDSNCITPGTEFMTKLDQQIKYFITKKVSNDSLWQNCTVIYSGHKTPGEGEHKIMDYIRFCRSQDSYDPNTRHCLYGLDADLIMLGLTSHEPHFSLLREEIIYGKKTRRIQTPEEINFYLFHISLLREYLNLEFAALHNIHFGYDIECVIDDVILLGFLVGNDFIPNLPELHINKEGLSLLFTIYKGCLPKLDGYINENGTLNFKRFEVFMEHLSKVEIDKFRDINDDQKYLASKSKKRIEDEMSGGLDFFIADNYKPESISNEEVLTTFQNLGIEQPEEFSESEDSSLPEDEQIFRSEFRQYKRNYYRTKFNFETVNDLVVKEVAVEYVRGIQWILNYYFNGICSWSWFYPFHYSPYISDVASFSDVHITYEMSTPFLPYQQLLAVLPPYSVSLVPEAYQHLMTRGDSALQDFYPKEFQTDLNGKVQEWEAVVLIPFIDEIRLSDAMESCNVNLLKEEADRNKHGSQFLYTYTEDNLGLYKAPAYFDSVTANHAAVREEPKDAWSLEQSDIFKGLHPNVNLNVHFNGFPTLRHLEFNFRIMKEDVKVFQQASRNESIILQVKSAETREVNEIVEQFLEKVIYVSWPHLCEAKVAAISDGEKKYQLVDHSIKAIDLSQNESTFWKSEVKDVSDSLLRRWGIDAGPTQLLVHCKNLCGLKYVCTREGVITLEKQWSTMLTTYPWQTCATNLQAYKPSYKTYERIEDLFPIGTKVFMLGNPYYGSMATVMNIIPEGGRIRVEMIRHQEPNLCAAQKNFYDVQEAYMTAYNASSRLNMSSSLLARVTGTILVSPAARLQPFQKDQKFVPKTNIGMNLKNNVQGEEVKGYTRKNNNLWLYSELCVREVEMYYNDFPEVFNFLSIEANRSTIYEDEIFQEDWKENFKKLKSYLEAAPFNKAERKKISALMLDASSLVLADAEIKKYSRIAAKPLHMQIRPHLLFLPSSLHGSSPPDSAATFELLDRVVNVMQGFCAPLGARGTIIGIHPKLKEVDTLYDVMFDEAFIGGCAFLGPISAGRCCRMYWAGMINLSHQDRKTDNVPKPHVTTADRAKWLERTDNRLDQGRNNYRTNRTQVYPSPTKSWRSEMSGFQVTTYNKSGTDTKPTLQKSLPTADCEQKERINAPAPSSLPPPGLFALKTASPISPKVEDTSNVDNKRQQTNEHQEITEEDDVQSLTAEQRHIIAQVSLRNQPQINAQLLQRDLENNETSRNVQFLIHGTNRVNWLNIKSNGFGNGPYVSCVNYVPDHFQLLIYLDIPSLLKNGYTFSELENNEISCSTNEGKIPFRYIDKAYNAVTNELFYVSPNCTNQYLNLPDINRAKVMGRGQGRKSLQELADMHDPPALHRRIVDGLQSLQSISKTRCCLFNQFNTQQQALNEKNTTSEQFQDSFQDIGIDKCTSTINLGQLGYPSLPVVEEGMESRDKVPKQNTTSSTLDFNETNFPSIGKSIFVPPQVFKRNSLVKCKSPQKVAEPQFSDVESNDKSVASKKEKSPVVERKTKKKVKRCRIMANFGAFPDRLS